MDIDVQAASIATPGEWRVRRLAVANGPNIFQMLLVYLNNFMVLYCVVVPLFLFHRRTLASYMSTMDVWRGIT